MLAHIQELICMPTISKQQQFILAGTRAALEGGTETPCSPKELLNDDDSPEPEADFVCFVTYGEITPRARATPA
jgi:hypothetical protein